MWINDPPLDWNDAYWRLRLTATPTKYNVDLVGITTRRRGGFGFRPSEIVSKPKRTKTGTRKHGQRKRAKRR